MKRKINTIRLFALMLVSSVTLLYGAKGTWHSTITNKIVSKDNKDSTEFEKFCAKFTWVKLPYPPEKEPPPDMVAPDPIYIPGDMVIKFLLNGKPRHFENDRFANRQTDDSGFYYGYFHRYPDKGHYVILEFTKQGNGIYDFIIASFTQKGKMLDEMLLLNRGDAEDSAKCTMYNRIDSNYNIILDRINNGEGVPSEDNPDSLCFKETNLIYTIDLNGKFKKIAEKEGSGWYISNGDFPGYHKAHIKK